MYNNDNPGRAIILIIVGAATAVVAGMTIELSVPAAIILGVPAVIALVVGVGNLTRGD